METVYSGGGFYLTKKGRRASFFRELTVSWGAWIIRFRTSWEMALTRQGEVTVWYMLSGLPPSSSVPSAWSVRRIIYQNLIDFSAFFNLFLL